MRRAKTDPGAAPAPHAPPTPTSNGFFISATAATAVEVLVMMAAVLPIGVTLTAVVNCWGISGPIMGPSSQSASLSIILSSMSSVVVRSRALMDLMLEEEGAAGALGMTGQMLGSGSLRWRLASVSSCRMANCPWAYSIQSSSVKV